MWPKIITVRGIAVQVETLDELDEFIQRYGSDITTGLPTPDNLMKPGKKPREGILARNDRVHLQHFVDRDNKGVLNKDLGKFLGAKGKAIGPALRIWGVRIGLADNKTAQAFERFSRPDGRGYKLSAPFLQIAKSLLEEQGS